MNYTLDLLIPRALQSLVHEPLICQYSILHANIVKEKLNIGLGWLKHSN